MSETVFFRLLAEKDKASALAAAICTITESRTLADTIHLVTSRQIRKVPTSPFAYWLTDPLRWMFLVLPPLEGGARRVRQGLATADDFRFIRTWWEVRPCRLLGGGSDDTVIPEYVPRWFREQTFHGKRWVPLAKGGEFAPFYADLSMTINWERDGEELKQWAGSLYGGSHWSRIIKNTDCYFMPGITWPLRGIRVSAQAVPSGAIFSIAGKLAISPDLWELANLLALMNSKPFDFFVRVFAGKVGGVQYESGLIGRVPVPTDVSDGPTHSFGMKALDSQISLQSIDERCHLFTSPTLAREQLANTIEQAMRLWDEQVKRAKEDFSEASDAVNERAYKLYGVSAEERTLIEIVLSAAEADVNADDGDGREGEIFASEESWSEDSDALSVTSDVLSWALGCAFGRWDIRIAVDRTLAPKLQDPFAPLPVCSPGMLVGADGLPAESGGIVSEAWLRARPDAITLPPEGAVGAVGAGEETISDDEYPLAVAWDGVLVDDEEHGSDVVRRVRAALEVIWGEGAEGIEREACELLGVASLREYFRNPRQFFEAHIKKYSKSRRKAPIYWLLQSSKRSYGVWLYLHRMTADTYYRVATEYVGPKVTLEMSRLEELQRDLAAKRDGLARSERVRREREVAAQESLVHELEDFKDEVERVARLDLALDLDDGVVLGIAPLHGLVPWKEARARWEELRAGKYPWSTMGQRMRERGLVRG